MCRICFRIAFALEAVGLSIDLSAAGARVHDPIVIDGASLPALLGQAIDRVVAFRYLDGWEQIPVQIDERAVVDFGRVLKRAPFDVYTLAYTDADTFTGADPDPNFDADDELVFMAADAGRLTRRAGPQGTIVGSGVEVRMVDPLDGTRSYVYLFASDGSLDPSAGRNYVDYEFELLSGDYKSTYKTGNGRNPEDSTIRSPAYDTHFSDRWIGDEVRIFAGEASGVDILDRHKTMFAPGNCGRTEDTFSQGAGAFFANIDGPVRVIRSYLGANSGTVTQRDHIGYATRQDVLMYLRVHSIGSLMDAYDFGPAAVGMIYYDNLNPLGVLVDGLPDDMRRGLLEWQLLSGEQGSITIVLRTDTDINQIPTSFYSDSVPPRFTQCTGDAFEYAMSGPFFTQGLPNTDPLREENPRKLVWIRRVFYEPPGATVEDAVLRSLQVTNPLRWSVRRFGPIAGALAVPVEP